ncbi:MAG TPA: NlpC/P60 family protein [Micromonosporaceae bacterium]|nr:NlpC/P60 family protein [Micromonosporaceae bacterium]
MPPLSRFQRYAPAAAAGVALAGLLAPLPAVAAPVEEPPAQTTIDQQIRAASDQLEIVIEQYDAVQVTLARTRAQEAVVDAQVTPLHDQVVSAQARVDAVAVVMYESTPLSTLAALTESASPDDALARLSTLDQLAYVRQTEVGSLRSLVDRYQAQQLSLARLEAVQSGQYAMLQAQRADINARIAKLKKLQAASTTRSSTPTIHYVPAYAPGPAGKAVQFAYDQIGKPYQWGSAGPGSYDCSGLTMAAWHAAGVSLPHNSAMQYDAVAHISRSQLSPGDLVFYFNPIHHVAIYIGGGNIIQAPQVGHPVGIAKIDGDPIYGYGRPG